MLLPALLFFFFFPHVFSHSSNDAKRNKRKACRGFRRTMKTSFDLRMRVVECLFCLLLG